MLQVWETLVAQVLLDPLDLKGVQVAQEQLDMETQVAQVEQVLLELQDLL